jgi:Flp pilus assembly protein TadD
MRVLGTLLACAGTAVVAPAPASAQGSYSPYDESPTAALARYVRTLASTPKDFNALVGAGRAALELGDTQAAAGFYARADEVNPRSPLPQAGMGAVSVANGEPLAALPYFTRAQQLGAPVAIFGADRGLAYDLLGRQAEAQADYRAALGGADGEEARRRLAMSLAISGKKAEAIQMLGPLMAKGDAAAARCRAFVLALTGDASGARVAIDAALPGSWSRVAPFLQRLPTLAAPQKAAAVNLGIFPDAGGTAYAYNAPVQSYPTTSALVASDRLAGIDDLLKGPAASAEPVRVAYVPPVRPQPAPVHQRAASVQPKIWLQLASGPNAAALPSEFERIKSKYSDLMEGIRGYVAKSGGRSRLVIGPFRGNSDAEIFLDDLQTVGVDAFKWTNSQTDQIVPLATQ